MVNGLATVHKTMQATETKAMRMGSIPLGSTTCVLRKYKALLKLFEASSHLRHLSFLNLRLRSSEFVPFRHLAVEKRPTLGRAL